MLTTEPKPVISGSTCPVCRKTFKNKWGAQVHYTVVHGKGRKPRTPKLPKIQPDQLEADQVTTPISFSNMVVNLLRQKPEGMTLSNLISRLKELGVKQADNSIRSNISHIVRNRPDLGIKRTDRGVYSISNQTTKPFSEEPQHGAQNQLQPDMTTIASNPMLLHLRIEQLSSQRDGLIRAIQSLIATMS